MTFALFIKVRNVNPPLESVATLVVDELERK